MKHLLEAINRRILKGLNENNIEVLTDLDVENLGLMDSILVKSVNNKIDGYILSIKQQLIDSINTEQISNKLKQLINDPENFDRFKGLIKANDRHHLEELIKIGLKLVGDNGNFNWIDTSEITDMSQLFFNARFNGHIELWDVSNVTDMSWMFSSAENFNLPIGDWDVSNVTNMRHMFFGAKLFNLPIGDWDVSSVNDMECMFSYASKFNQPIGDWDVINVTNMTCMFYCAYEFNLPIGDWDVSNVTRYFHIFFDCPIKKEYKPQFIK